MSEQLAHEMFEKLAGGPDAAFRLNRMWNETYEPSHYDRTFRNAPDKRTKFITKARSAGYSTKAINAFLDL